MLFIPKVYEEVVRSDGSNLPLWFCTCALLLLEENPIPIPSDIKETNEGDRFYAGE